MSITPKIMKKLFLVLVIALGSILPSQGQWENSEKVPVLIINENENDYTVLEQYETDFIYVGLGAEETPQHYYAGITGFFFRNNKRGVVDVIVTLAGKKLLSSDMGHFAGMDITFGNDEKLIMRATDYKPDSAYVVKRWLPENYGMNCCSVTMSIPLTKEKLERLMCTIATNIKLVFKYGANDERTADVTNDGVTIPGIITLLSIIDEVWSIMDKNSKYY